MFRAFNEATADQLWQSVALAFTRGESRSVGSRAGSTHEMLHVAISIAEPRERWVVCRQPPLNPAFGLVEVIWILSGRNDSAFLNYFNRHLPRFAGFGSSYYGAYGYRLRKHLGLDQIERAYWALRGDPESRQVVLQIWDAASDLPDKYGKARSDDIPCNVVSLLKVRDGKLEWTQVLRSNDFYRGLPYNIVQFTSLQEIVAGWLDLEVGSYCQISDSLHIYEEDYEAVRKLVPVDAVRNSDSLSFKKAESNELFAELSRRVEVFVQERLSKAEHLRLAKWSEAPPAFQNMLCLISSEAARRREWSEEATAIMRECTNPAFVQLWDRWLSRLNGRKSIAVNA